MEEKKKKNTPRTPVSLESQERLIQIMTDSPSLVKFRGTEWEITALKPGTQWEIAKEAIAITKNESANYEDVIRQFALNTPSVARVITLGLLNDRKRIFANGRDGEKSEEFNAVYDTLMWMDDMSGWPALLLQILGLLDVEFFFSTTSSITILRSRLLERKMTMTEAKLLLQEPNSVK